MLDLTFKLGQRYKICGLRASMPRSYRDKLLSMGLIPGARFQVVRFAPFGDALQIEVNDFNLSLRAKELKGMVLEAVE
jgi:ferrous iron transport protein A